ncbi:MAG TPA: recombinase family protein [Gaiellaceae bacterium]|nr:recombinase family protein [Gaiellaceae bacterium]
MRAIGYLRVSTRGQAERGMGLETQRDRVTAYAKQEGYELVEVLKESASGAVQEGSLFSHEHRPILTSLIERAGRGEFDVLLVATFDRLSRDYMSLLFLKRLLRTYGVETVSAAGENGNGDAVGELIEQVIAAIHEFERKRILERMRGGKAKRKEQGRHVHGRIPYGYVTSAGELRPSEPQASIVRRIFTEAKAGDSPDRITRGLNRDGIDGPTGKSWNRTTVRNVLTNTVYAGERYGVKKAHAAIVSRRVWNETQRALEARSKR